ncbi:MAG TPA: lasso peptide biosynthesis B2 protein [Terracidiphilus sp.]|jgi:hypothetical protein|nr:lasso peptide biosynthesis B2 protein [Terracidiphilus sp.]
MTRLVAEALYYLVRTEWRMRRGGLSALHDMLKETESPNSLPSQLTPEQLCKAVDMACVLYFKSVLCLQRSVATAVLLRHHRFPAKLVIGARILPFKSHAWVELRGQVINDKPYIPQLYRELERC